jgi:acetate kinase
MDTILLVNAGSSSVKFQVFGTDTARKLTRRIKGQLDGIATRPPSASKRAGWQAHCGSHL